MAKKYIDDSIKEEKIQQSKLRRIQIYKMLDYYNGDNYNKYIKDRFKSTAFQEIPVMGLNITKRFIDRMSRIYTLGASRTVPSSQDLYDSLTIKKSIRMKHAEKMTNLLGTTALQVVWDENGGNPRFDYIPRYAFDVILDDMNPLKPIAIKYPVMLKTDDASSDNNVLQYAYWDDSGYIIYDENGKELQAETHDYGVLPFTFLHRDNQQLGFYVPGAVDIVSANEMLNILYTEMNLGMRFQMFGQYVVTGMYSDETIQRAGSDEIMIVPEGANVQILSPNIKTDQAINLAKSMLEITASNNHLSISFVDPQKDRPQSGEALKIRDLERKDKYVDNKAIWEDSEMDIYNLERIIAQNNNRSLPDSMGVDFNEPENVMGINDQIQWNNHLLETNLTTQAKLLQNQNKDLTIEQAQEIVNQNKETNGKQQETGSIFTQLRNES